MALVRNSLLRNALFALGWIFFTVGIVAIVLPLVPTTPFIILSAMCFSRSSERFHQWLLNHRWVGSSLRDWESHGVIRPRAKAMAIALMAVGFSYPLFFVPVKLGVKVLISVIGLSVASYILTRPSGRGFVKPL